MLKSYRNFFFWFSITIFSNIMCLCSVSCLLFWEADSFCSWVSVHYEACYSFLPSVQTFIIPNKIRHALVKLVVYFKTVTQTPGPWFLDITPTFLLLIFVFRFFLSCLKKNQWHLTPYEHLPGNQHFSG